MDILPKFVENPLMSITGDMVTWRGMAWSQKIRLINGLQ